MTIDILPADGIITVAALADFLGTNANSLQQRLTDKGIPTLKLASNYTQRIVRLEDLRVK